MEIKDLVPAEGSTKNRKRVGRGPASGHGKTAGRGMNGQLSRSGFSDPRHCTGFGGDDVLNGFKHRRIAPDHNGQAPFFGAGFAARDRRIQKVFAFARKPLCHLARHFR